MKEENLNLMKESIVKYFRKGVPMLKKDKKVDIENKPSIIQGPVQGRTIIGEKIAIDGAIAAA